MTARLRGPVRTFVREVSMVRKILARLGYVPAACVHRKIVIAHQGSGVAADGEVTLDLAVSCECGVAWPHPAFRTGIRVVTDRTTKPIARA